VKSKTFLNEIKNLSKAELKAKKVALKEELMKLRFKGAVNQLEKGHLLNALRKDVARIETVLKGK
jgi:large subunit ribosomal protein L29